MGMDISQGFSRKSALQGSLKNVAPSCLQSNFTEEQPSASPWLWNRLRSGVQHHLHQTHSFWFNTILALQKPPDFPPGSLSKSQKLFLHSFSWKCPCHGQHPSLPARSFRAGGGCQPSPPGELLGLWLSAALSAVTAKVLPGCHSKGAHSLLGCPQGGHVFSHLIPFFCWISGG